MLPTIDCLSPTPFLVVGDDRLVAIGPRLVVLGDAEHDYAADGVGHAADIAGELLLALVGSGVGGVYAAATLGIFLREFTHGHTRQLSAALRRHLVALAARAPVLAGIGDRVFIDIDSVLRPVYGHAKQGASFGHTKIAGKTILRGLSPLAAIITTPTAAPVVAAVRLRAGRAGSAKGAASMLTEAVVQVEQRSSVRGDRPSSGSSIRDSNRQVGPFTLPCRQGLHEPGVIRSIIWSRCSGRMSAMPSPATPHDADISPTRPLPQPGGHRQVGPDRSRRFMWAAVTGAASMTVTAVLTVTRSGDDIQPLRAPAAAWATGSPVSPATDPTIAEPSSSSSPSLRSSPSPSPSPSPTSQPAKPSPRPSLTELITGLHATVSRLVRDGQLTGDSGEELTKRLHETADELARGDVDKARRKLAEFAEKAINLRKEGKLSSTGYQTLAAGRTQFVQTLPRR